MAYVVARVDSNKTSRSRRRQAWHDTLRTS